MLPFLKETLNQLVMHSVILTEFGISVFNEGKLEKAFPFSDPVKDYLSIKNKQARLEELIDYLASQHIEKKFYRHSVNGRNRIRRDSIIQATDYC